MSRLKKTFDEDSLNFKAKSEKGAALVIVILIMLLLMGFVAIVLSRANTETILTATDSAENRSLAASQAQIESDSRDFINLFKRKLSPPNSDIDIIRNSTISGFSDFDLSKKTILQTKNSTAVEITGGNYAGLYSLRDEWEITVRRHRGHPARGHRRPERRVFRRHERHLPRIKNGLRERRVS